MSKLSKRWYRGAWACAAVALATLPALAAANADGAAGGAGGPSSRPNTGAAGASGPSSAGGTAGGAPLVPGATTRDPLCERDWPIDVYRVVLGTHPDNGKRLIEFDPKHPAVPYQISGARFFFGTKGSVHRVVGEYLSRREAEAAQDDIDLNHRDLRNGSDPPRVQDFGAYFPDAPRACTIKRSPLVENASWVVEANGIQLVSNKKGCDKGGGKVVKKIAAMTCDGTKELFADTVIAECEGEFAPRITTCVWRLTPEVIVFDHKSSREGGTDIHVRVYDVAKKKRIQSIDASNEGGEGTEIMSFGDSDGDGVPEAIYQRAGESRVTTRLDWNGKRFVEARRK